MTMWQREPRAAMNRALDDELDAQERAALNAHLDDQPTDAAHWAKLRRVDQTLSSAATFSAPAGFADRMLAVLSKRLPAKFDHERGAAFALGLYSALALSVAILAGGLIGLIALWKAGIFVVIDGARATLIQSWTALQSAIMHTANAPLIALIAIIGTFAAATLSRIVALPGTTATYRIPVQFSM